MEKYPFYMQEYKDRVERVRGEMDKQGFDALLIFAPQNMYYLTGYTTLGYYEQQALLLPRDGEPTLIVRLLEDMNIRETSWVKRSITFTDDEDPLTVMATTLKTERLKGKRIGAEADSWKCRMTHYSFEKLKKASGVKLVPIGPFGTGPIEKCRLIKSKREIEFIRRAAEIASKAMRTGISNVREGINENIVAAEVWRELLKNGSEYPAHQPFVVGGPRSGQAHATYAARKLKKGDVVFFEIGASVKRYHGALSRSTTVGEPSKKVKEISEIAKKSLDEAVRAIRPGVTAEAVDNACWEGLLKAGYGKYRHRCGYSIGIEWGEGDLMSLRQGELSVLKPGMVFHMPGSTTLVPGLGGIGFSETVLVTKTGHEVLTNVERKLFIN